MAGVIERIKESFQDHSPYWNTVKFTIEHLDKLNKKVRKLYNVEEKIILTPLKDLKKEEADLDLIFSSVAKEVEEVGNLIKACVTEYNNTAKKNFSVLKKLKKHHINNKLGLIEDNLNVLRPDMNEMLKTRHHKVFLHYLEDMKQALGTVLEAIDSIAELIKRLERDEREMQKYLVTKDELESLYDDFH